ncbi:MAG: DEAD/DEAH box helicase [Pseudomonadota bacterium]
MMQLRDYQQQAITDCFTCLRAHPDKAPLIVLPTGSGKSLVIAEIVRKTLIAKPIKRFLILTHVKELVQQNALEFAQFAPAIDIGIYSAGLGKKEAGHSVIFSTVQSFVNHVYDAGVFDGVIIDEAHRVPPSGQGQYRTTLDALKTINPNIKIIGLTATPFRMGQGYLTESLPDGSAPMFDTICHETQVLDLMQAGYLAPVTSRRGQHTADTSGLHIRKGEFIESEMVEAFEPILLEATAEIARMTAATNRKKWLIFTASIEQAELVADQLQKRVEIPVYLVTSKTDNRDQIINQYKQADRAALVNVNILTTGFNAPDVDMIALLRATASTSLYVQIVGRGTRTAPGKANCHVLDFGNNVERHGAIDQPLVKSKGKGEAPVKNCPDCGLIVPISTRECPECRYEFPLPEERQSNLNTRATNGGILSTEATAHSVSFVTINIHQKFDSDKPPSVRLDYYKPEKWDRPVVSQWLCFEHGGRAAAIAKNRLMQLGIEEREIEEDSDAMADKLEDWFANGRIDIKTVYTIPQKGNPKYKEVVGLETNDQEAA